MEFKDFGQAAVNAIILFYFFETFCEDAAHHKLRGSINFVFFGLTDQSYGYLKFLGEVRAAKKLLFFNFFELNFFS
jgi:hypothetical protein